RTGRSGVPPGCRHVREEALARFVPVRLAETYAVDVGNAHAHRRVVRDDAQVKEAAGGRKNGFFFDTFNDPEPVVRVDDLVADLECHVSPVAGRRMEGPVWRRELHSRV